MKDTNKNFLTMLENNIEYYKEYIKTPIEKRKYITKKECCLYMKNLSVKESVVDKDGKFEKHLSIKKALEYMCENKIKKVFSKNRGECILYLKEDIKRFNKEREKNNNRKIYKEYDKKIKFDSETKLLSYLTSVAHNKVFNDKNIDKKTNIERLKWLNRKGVYLSYSNFYNFYYYKKRNKYLSFYYLEKIFKLYKLNLPEVIFYYFENKMLKND